MLKIARVKFNSDPTWVMNPEDKDASKKSALNNILVNNPELRPYLEDDTNLILTGQKSGF